MPNNAREGRADDTSVRVFVVADDPGTADITEVLRAAEDIEIVGQVGRDPDEAQDRFKQANASMAIIDVRNHEDGIAFCRELRDRFPDVVCLVVSGFEGDEAKVDAILCGADDDLDLEAEDVHERVRSANAGNSSIRQFLREAR